MVAYRAHCPISGLARAAALGALCLPLLLAGCASGGGRETIPAASAGTAHSVEVGTVMDVRLVNIEGKTSGVGYGVGAGAGAAVGSTIGGSPEGRALGTAGGIIAGGIIGPRIEKAMTQKVAQEVTVQREDGYSVVVVTHEGLEPEFRPGDRVEILETRTGKARLRLLGPGGSDDGSVFLPPGVDPESWEEFSW